MKPTKFNKISEKIDIFFPFSLKWKREVNQDGPWGLYMYLCEDNWKLKISSVGKVSAALFFYLKVVKQKSEVNTSILEVT